jgi:CheY-specific phosphatase CheX
MRVDYILTVIDSIEAYFSEELLIPLSRKELELREGFGNPQEGILIDLKGNIEGKILVSFSKGFSEYVISTMINDYSKDDVVFAKAALKELVNQMAAKIINKLDEEGINWDIGVPNIIVNGEPDLSSIKLESLYVPYVDSHGNMEITVAIKELEEGEIHG